MFRNLICFYGKELLAPRPTSPKLEDHPVSAVRNCLFNIFAATLHIGGRSSIRNLMTRHAVVAGTHLSRFASAYMRHKGGKKEKGRTCGRIGSETNFSNPVSEDSLSSVCACHSSGHLICY
jgi:hypothetical protein